MFVICRSSHLVPWYLLAHISKVADTLKVSHMQNEERKTRKMRFESEKKCLLVYRSTGLRGWQAAAVNELRFFLHDLNSTVTLLILSNCPELSECNFPVHCIWRREICRFWHEIMTFYILLLFSLDMHKFSMVHSRCKSANVSRKSFVYLFPTRTWIYAYELPKYCSPIWKGVENVFRTFWCFCLNEWKTLNSRTFLVKKSQTITWQLNNCDSIGRECIECIALFYGHCNVTSAGGFTQTQFSHSWWKIKSPINFKINYSLSPTEERWWGVVKSSKWNICWVCLTFCKVDNGQQYVKCWSDEIFVPLHIEVRDIQFSYGNSHHHHQKNIYCV